MAGVIVIDSIIRGRFQSASLSYAAFAPAAGRGYLSEGLDTAEMTGFPLVSPHPTRPAH